MDAGSAQLLTGPALFVVLVVGVLLIVVATARYKLHPFLSLLLGAYAIGLASGLPASKIVAALTGGFGRTVGAIGIVIACGSIIGKVLERSGGALAMAETVLRIIGRTRAVVAMAATGAVVSVPVFCDSGYVLLSPLNRALARQTGISIASFAVALGMGLYATHCLVPPTPGPIAVAGELHAELGTVILFGLLVAVPVVIATCAYGIFIGKRIVIHPGVPDEPAPQSGPQPPPLGATAAFAPVVLPVLLIALRSVAEFPGSPLAGAKSVLSFLGEPNTALILGVLMAGFVARKHGLAEFGTWCGDGLKDAGTIILITAAGGALGGVLRETALAKLVGDTLSTLDLGRLNILLPFVIAAALKTALGSSTVAMITTASLVSPLLVAMGLGAGLGPVLTTLAIASGAMMVSHVNDSYFWVITQMSGLTVTQGYRLVTVASGIAGLAAISTVLLLSFALL